MYESRYLNLQSCPGVIVPKLLFDDEAQVRADEFPAILPRSIYT